jgi:hypothetical protein
MASLWQLPAIGREENTFLITYELLMILNLTLIYTNTYLYFSIFSFKFIECKIIKNCIKELGLMNFNPLNNRNNDNDSKKTSLNNYKVIAHEGVMPVTVRMLGESL